MKRLLHFLLSAAALLASCACNLLDPPDEGRVEDLSGQISISMLDVLSGSSGNAEPEAAESLPDTNSFIIKVENSAGKVLYNGVYSKSPQSIIAAPDTYHIRIVSGDFTKPAFDTPQWGDDQYVKLSAGQRVNVKLVCRQLNAGVKMKIAPSFLTEYPDGSLLLKASSGSLLYAYKEKRTAFFPPGTVSLVLSRGSRDETLLSRQMGEGEILCLNISAAPSSQKDDLTGGSFSVRVDTLRTYLHENYVIGGQNSTKGEGAENALTIAQAMGAVGSADVWVGGFIVGGDMTSRSMSFDAPFSSSTHIGIGPRSNTASKDACISVQLPSGGVRDALNLADHPSLLGRYVCIKGDIVDSYYGIVGIKNVSDFVLK